MAKIKCDCCYEQTNLHETFRHGKQRICDGCEHLCPVADRPCEGVMPPGMDMDADITIAGTTVEAVVGALLNPKN